jgi:cytochrome c556
VWAEQVPDRLDRNMMPLLSRSFRIKRRCGVFALCIACIAATALAQTKPESVIHYRQSLMDLIGWNYDLLAAMARARAPIDTKEFSLRAERLASFGPQVLEGFSKGSDKGAVTDAGAEIWTDFDGFQAVANDFISESKKLAEIAKNGDEAQIKEQFRKVTGTCKTCHDKYKAD